MDKYQQLRQFISDFIQGPNSEALLRTLAEQCQKGDDLSVAVTDQLTICTSSGVYTDKLLAAYNVIRPSELGMEDLAFKKMGIQINQAKQITEALHVVLATFYGDETVRAYTTSTIAAPYSFAEGDDLAFKLESGETLTLTLTGDEFENAQNATAEETADVITRFVRSLGTDAYAQVYLDVDTNLKYVRIFGGAKGPYSFVQVIGGRIQSKLEFPSMRETFLPSNTTVWEITRNVGSRHRFRWVSGPAPALDQVLVDDKLLLYGPQFESSGFVDTYDVVQVRPPQPSPSPDAGYFEIEIQGTTPLSSSAPDVLPPPNTPGNTYSITVTQNSYDDLKFFLARRATAYAQRRYALAWEPADNLLRVYMPATTKVVKRDLIGSAHIHSLYGSAELNGTFGSASELEDQVIILSEYSIMYRQRGFDVYGSGGTLTVGVTPIDVDYAAREGGFTHVVTLTPHGLTGTADDFGTVRTTSIVNLQLGNILIDDPINSFLGPYVIDPTKNYTLSTTVARTRERILAGETRSTLLVEGTLPNEPGQLLFSLNSDQEETPVRYVAAQTTSSLLPVPIAVISQNGTTVTVTTSQPHGAVAGQNVQIAGTVNFNGPRLVDTVPSATTYTFQKTPAAVVVENAGTSQPIIDGEITTLILDSSYMFKNTHEVGADVNLLSDTKVYEPALDGTDYGFYVTGTAQGRIFAAQLMQQITALGINLEIVIIYPSDNGLGNEGDSDSLSNPPTSDKVYVWGGDDA